MSSGTFGVRRGKPLQTSPRVDHFERFKLRARRAARAAPPNRGGGSARGHPAPVRMPRGGSGCGLANRPPYECSDLYTQAALDEAPHWCRRRRRPSGTSGGHCPTRMGPVVGKCEVVHCAGAAGGGGLFVPAAGLVQVGRWSASRLARLTIAWVLPAAACSCQRRAWSRSGGSSGWRAGIRG